MSGAPCFVLVPRTPWRIAVWRLGATMRGDPAPTLCLPGVTAPRRAEWLAAGREAWRFDWLDSGASDRCLAGCCPDTRHQLAAVVALMVAEIGRFQVTLLADPADAAAAREFAAHYPFAVARLVIDHRRGAAA